MGAEPTFLLYRGEKSAKMTGTDWKTEVEKMVDTNGLELVEIKVEPRGKFDIIKLFVDKEGGISVGECSKLARRINNYLSEEQDYGKEYRLEVSSPGLDRPLTELKHFLRNLNRQLKVTYTEDDANRSVEGTLVSADEEKIVLKLKKAETEIPLNSIQKAEISLPW